MEHLLGDLAVILDIGTSTHPGAVRALNEDSVGHVVPDRSDVLERRGALFVVADGLGGHASGEVASATAVEVITEFYFSPRAPYGIEASLQTATQAANARVCSLAQSASDVVRGMQTTLSALVLAGRQAYIAHVGDSRIYRLRRGVFTQLTSDHSEAAELLRLRLITSEQAENHPRRSVLTRTIGSSLQLRPDFSRHSVEDGDLFLLCTDGLWGEVSDLEIAKVLEGPSTAACETLVEMACAHGGGDNVTVQCVRVEDAGVGRRDGPPGRLSRLLAGLRGG